MSKAKKVVMTLLPVAAIVSLATLLTPLPSVLYGETSMEFRVDVILSFFFALLYLIGGLLFSMGVGGFTNKLRSVYLTICAGTVILGLTFLQLPVTSMLNAWNDRWASSGAIAIPFVVGGIVLFWGVHLYSKLIDTRTIWSNWVVILLVTIVGALLSILLPHAPIQSSELVFNFGVAIRVAVVLPLLAASLVVLCIKRDSGTMYGGALAWLFTSLVVTDLALISAIFLIVRGLSNDPKWFISLDVFYTISAALWVTAGYSFTRISSSLNETVKTSPANLN